MIDLNGLILNSFKVSDSSGAEQDKDRDDSSIDPGSFLLLLSELFSTGVMNNEESANEVNLNNKSSIDTSTDGVQLISSNSVTGSVMQELNCQIGGTIKSNDSFNGSLDTNIALAWIDSEQFEPPLIDPVMKELSDAEQQTRQLDGHLITEHMKDYESELTSVDNEFFNEYKDNSLQGLNHLNVNPSIEVSEHVESLFELHNESVVNVSEHILNPVQTELLNNQINQDVIGIVKSKSLDISIPISDSQWGEQFSEHIIWLGHQEFKHALIKINPEDLGPLEISVKVVKDTASVNIISHSTHVRDIVDHAMPRLRDMLAEQGLDLIEVHIGTDDNSRQSEQHHNGPAGAVMHEVEDGALITPLKKQSSKGLIDYFA